eukprot:5655165-Pleurochrysis_carterae.AAC.1
MHGHSIEKRGHSALQYARRCPCLRATLCACKCACVWGGMDDTLPRLPLRSLALTSRRAYANLNHADCYARASDFLILCVHCMRADSSCATRSQTKRPRRSNTTTGTERCA